MKISSILTADAGPLGTGEHHFRDDWNDEISSRVLISGPNGSGKSTLLRGIATLWSAFGFWLERRDRLDKRSADRAWLQKWGSIALLLEDLPYSGPPLLLIFGEPAWADELKARFPEACMVGETVFRSGTAGAPTRQLYWPKDSEWKSWLDEWTRQRQAMVTLREPTSSPNIVFLDAEERRWVEARRGKGELTQENLGQRWLPRYQANEDWESQLEAGLLNLKIAAPERFSGLIDDLNGFLQGKELLKTVKLGENRLKVKLKRSGNGIHDLDDLSAGEHQVLILLYQIGRWLEQGGIALIDEPDLHVHPSIVPALLGQLEKMVVTDRHGQLFVTSHSPEVWQRYEALGQRIVLEAKS